jgi:hypothetical protein
MHDYRALYEFRFNDMSDRYYPANLARRDQPAPPIVKTTSDQTNTLENSGTAPMVSDTFPLAVEPLSFDKASLSAYPYHW